MMNKETLAEIQIVLADELNFVHGNLRNKRIRVVELQHELELAEAAHNRLLTRAELLNNLISVIGEELHEPTG